MAAGERVMQRRKITSMSLAELKAEQAACRACGCRPCAVRRLNIEERMVALMVLTPPEPEEEDLSHLDPILLAAGIRAPKAKLKRQMEPKARIEAGKRFTKIIFGPRTTKGIAQQQERFDRLHGLRGVVVRG